MENKSKPLILIVDDIKENLRVLGTHLRRYDYDIAVATSGKEALEVLTDITPDLILLDIMMPEMDGFQACEAIKSNDSTKDIPIIFLTAQSDEQSIVSAFQIGAADYLTKPVNIAELTARVDTHVKLKMSNDKLKIYNDRLRNLLKDRAEFMGIAAHDMKNPLNSIIAYSDLLINTVNLQKFNKEETIEKLSIIKNSASFMLESITELLNHDILEAGYREIKLEQNSPVKIIETILINNILWAESKNIRIKYLKYPDFDILMDEDAARDIFQNIVSNALKYSNPDSTIWVTLSRVSKEGLHYIRFSVKDQGQGIKEHDKSKLFKKMQKLTARPTAGEGSTGMGLYIVKKLTELHGGQVNVISEYGKGTEFIVDFPIDDFSSLNYLKYYEDIDVENDYSIFEDNHKEQKKKWDYLKEIEKEVNTLDKDKAKSHSEKLIDFYYYIRKTNVINDIRKFASEIRSFGSDINSNTFQEYGDELNKLAITFDIENLPSLLDMFPNILKTAIKK